MSPHKCLTCGGDITEGQEEKKAAGRFVHVNYEDCQAELRGPSEAAAAARSYRIRQRGGVVARHPSVSEQEMHERRG